MGVWAFASQAGGDLLMMRRRDFVVGAAAWPLAARARQPSVPVIGFFDWGSRDTSERALAVFRKGLADAGYVEGQNVTIEYRWAEGRYDRLPELAADLVRRKVAAIVATGALPTAIAAKAATATIPIVVVAGGDPVKRGLAASLNRPGGNVTGITFISAELAGKRLDLLRKIAPHATTFAYLSGGPRNAFEEEESNTVAEARALGLQLIVVEARSERDIEAAFATLVQREAGALIVGVVAHFTYNRDRIVALADRHKIAAMYPFPIYAFRGGLMSYGADALAALRQLGVDYVGPILKGANPADLPIQQPTKFELIINQKTAKMLGLEIPRILLALADRVID
jgi:putative ABC transport system substrate-binding protein